MSLDLPDQPPLNHLAVIMDGNGRWAQKQGLPRIAGHQKGVQTVIDIVDECLRLGIGHLTLFAFSSENWGRPDQEVEMLMELLVRFLDSQRSKMLHHGIRLRVIGDRSRLSVKVQAVLAETEEATSGGNGLVLFLALSYGGRDEIARAARKIAANVARGVQDIDLIDEKVLGEHLDTAGYPDPDLLIRTSGEMRISNFLLWQLAYSELYITEVLWPDFNSEELQRALRVYQQRQRRFGLIEDQVSPDKEKTD